MAVEVTGHSYFEAMNWTERDNLLLLHTVNTNVRPSGQASWVNVKPIPGRTKRAMEQQWSSQLKPRCRWNGKNYVLRQSNLFDKVTPIANVENTKKTPQNASTGVLPKRVVVKKSFLWGAFKFERYE
jgi:hypothetical protein